MFTSSVPGPPFLASTACQAACKLRQSSTRSIINRSRSPRRDTRECSRRNHRLLGEDQVEYVAAITKPKHLDRYPVVENGAESDGEGHRSLVEETHFGA